MRIVKTVRCGTLYAQIWEYWDSGIHLQRLASQIPHLRIWWLAAERHLYTATSRWLAGEPIAREAVWQRVESHPFQWLGSRSNEGYPISNANAGATVCLLDNHLKQRILMHLGRTDGTYCLSYYPTFDPRGNQSKSRSYVSYRAAGCKRYLRTSTRSKHYEGRSLSNAVEALELLVRQGSYVGNSDFYRVLKRCIAEKDLENGIRVHALVLRRGYESNAFLANHLICLYSSHGKLEEASKAFSKVAAPDRYMWASIILAHTRHGQPREAINLYRRMRELNVNPDNHIFVAILSACATAHDLFAGREVHAIILGTSDEPNLFVGNCLVDMYSKCGSLEDARRVFDNLPTRDVVTWNAMIAGYVQHGFNQEALSLYETMQLEGIIAADALTFVSLLQACGSLAGLKTGKELHTQILQIEPKGPSLCVANALIDMYGKCGSMDDAQKVFDALSVKDVVTWSALIAGYARQGDCELVFDAFDRMRQEGIEPDGITFLSVITACSHAGLLKRGQNYFEAMSRDHGISPTNEHYNCMVDLLGRAGHVDKAMEMVKSMPYQPDAELWKSVLSACRKWKNVDIGRQAFQFAVSLDENDAAPYILMSNIYASANMHKEAREMQDIRVDACAWKQPGQSWWTDTGGTVHTFAVGDKGYPEVQQIHAKLEDLLVNM